MSFLKEKPSRAIFLPVTVLKRQSMILQAKRRLWYSFMSITWERSDPSRWGGGKHQGSQTPQDELVPHLLPVRSHLGQVEGLAEIHQIKHVFLETAPTKTCMNESQISFFKSNKNKFPFSPHVQNLLWRCLIIVHLACWYSNFVVTDWTPVTEYFNLYTYSSTCLIKILFP